MVGSAATAREDAWSDIDLVLQVRANASPDAVAERWTAEIYARHQAVHHLDVVARGVLYRVHLLASSLQVDVSFWPEHEFRGTEAGFHLIFGRANEATEPTPVNAEHLVGMGWLYALHARSALARGRTWQAVLMLDELRNQVVALACLRHGLDPHHGRGADQLPTGLVEDLLAARAERPDRDQLAASLRALLDLLLAEARADDPGLAARLAPVADVLGGA